jgi:hypothetical protein
MASRTTTNVVIALVVLAVLIIAYAVHEAGGAKRAGMTNGSSPHRFEGATANLAWLLKPDVDYSGAVLVSGYIDAYPHRGAPDACSRMPIESPIPLNARNLAWIDDALTASCGVGVRPEWFVADVDVAYGQGTYGSGREGFACWGQTNSRENYRGGRKGRTNSRLAEGFTTIAENFATGCAACVGGAVEGFTAGGIATGCAACAEGFAAIPVFESQQSWEYPSQEGLERTCGREGYRSRNFQPDRPGVCGRAPNPAATVEMRGLQVADGVV